MAQQRLTHAKTAGPLAAATMMARNRLSDDKGTFGISPELQAGAERLFDRLKNGERAALARAITLAESKHATHHYIGQKLVAEALNLTQSQSARTSDKSKPTFRIGLTGPPGTGKSTFIEAFGSYLVGMGNKVAVLSIDPSSSLTGGSLLGDKTRMPTLSIDPNAYIRPSPSSGTLGGVARNTCDSMVLCEAAGYNIVLIETVGVGQSETAVADMVDMYVMLVPPAGGDVLQGLKRGIVELVDLILVTKSDGDLLPAARRARQEYLSALKLLRKRSSVWSPDVLSISSTTGSGLEDAWKSMTLFHDIMRESDRLQRKRNQQSKIWMWQYVNDRIMQRFRHYPPVSEMIDEIEQLVSVGQLTAGQGADILLTKFSEADQL